MDAEIARIIILSFIDGTPKQTIAKSLNAADHVTARGKQWSDMAVTRNLQQIANSDSDAVLATTRQHSLTALNELPATTKPPKFLLSGILKCSKGTNMYVPSMRSKSYRCSCCDSSVQKSDVEAVVIDYLSDVALAPDSHQALQSTPLDIDGKNMSAMLGKITHPVFTPEFLTNKNTPLRQLVDILIHSIVYNAEREEFCIKTFLPS